MLEHASMTSVQVGSETVELGKPKPDWKPLYLFNLYRLTVTTVFVVSFIADVSPSFLGRFDERLFLVTAWGYSGFALLCEVLIQKRWPQFHIQVLGQVLVDIFAITLLMHASGGVNSGLGMLLVVAIAGGSLLTEGRTAIFFAAVASLAVLIQVTLMDIYYWFPDTSYSHAGMLGVTFFATAFLAFVLAQRVRASEALAKQRGLHVEYLAQLNAQIVQHIQSGIIVIDGHQQIRLFNEAARQLLGLKTEPDGQLLSVLLPELTEQLIAWQRSVLSKTSSLFRPQSGEVDVIATFTQLNNRSGNISTLIVLEDATLMAQRAQQLKLASLGRLTASIAHEIRNPLGAISHASQLLTESQSLAAQPQRLAQIITDNTQRVNTIIENVLQLSRREAAHTECFELIQWLTTFVEEFISIHDIQLTDIEIRRHQVETLIVCFDPIHLYQVLNNLCDNGLRYSQASPLLILTLGMSDSNRPYLDVCDQGTGMSEEVQKQIFEPFFTTENTGTGLGLYIAREICEANQAALHMIANTPNGCCFRIHFSEYQTELNS